MARTATARQLPQTPVPRTPPVETTLLALVQALGEITSDDREVIATARHMINTGSVKLIGILRGQKLD